MEQCNEKTGREDGDVNQNDYNNENDLDDVFFPVTVVHKTVTNVNVEDSNKQDNKKFLDDDAIMRCFDLSVSAHIKLAKVPVYEPFPSGSSKTNDAH